MRDNYNTSIDLFNAILEMLEAGEIDHYESTILFILLRQTVGYKKKSDGISYNQFSRKAGLSRRKTIQVIDDLIAKRLIKRKRQKSKRGDADYNRYSLNFENILSKKVVHEMHYRSAGDAPGVVHEMHPQLNNLTSKRERTGCDDFVFAGMSEREFEREVEDFLEHISIHAVSPSAYKRKVRRKIYRCETETMKEFERHYLKKTCNALREKYAGEFVAGAEITEIYSYLDTEGFNSSYKFLMKVRLNRGAFIFGFASRQDLEAAIRSDVPGEYAILQHEVAA